MDIGDMDVEEFQRRWQRAKHDWDRISQKKLEKDVAGEELTDAEASQWSRARAEFVAAEQMWDELYRLGIVVLVGGDVDDGADTDGGDHLAGLHEQVVASPLDDAPRLAYADAVEAEDQQRAEFIRLQIVLAQRRRENLTGPDEPMGGYQREGALISSRGAEWAGDVSGLVAGWQFVRGFVEVAHLDAAAFLAAAPELYRRAPMLGLNLTRVAPVAAELFASPYLRRIRSLSMVGEFRGENLGDAEAIALASSPHLAELEWLELANNGIGAAGLEALAASEALPRLGYLGFSGNAADDPTPRFADEYDADSAAAIEFQRRYGPRAWLSARVRPTWPPYRDAVW